jgi:methyl-accepting chemotaxis protein
VVLKIKRLIGLESLTGKFLLITGTVLLLLFTLLYLYRFNAISKPIEQQFMEEGKALAISLSKALESITETDMNNGVTLQNGQYISGAQLKNILFDDTLTLLPESEEVAQMRMKDKTYAESQQKLFDGTEIPMWKYELKYTSAFDQYTDQRWQGLIDSYMVSDSIVFALPTLYSDNPEAAGYIPTHNHMYSPTGESSIDTWGTEGLLSQKYRANRVFNDSTGYKAAMNKDTQDPLVQIYPRVIGGEIVTMWDISYPIMLQDEQWGAVRVAMSKQKADEMVADQRKQVLNQYIFLFFTIMILLFILTVVLVRKRIKILTETTNIIFASGSIDLTKNFNTKGKDEISHLAIGLNKLMEQVKDLIYSIQTMSREVTGSSNILSQSVEQTTNAAAQFNTTILEVSAGAKKQAGGARDGATAMEEMAAGIQRIAESSSQIAEHSQDMVSRLKRGNEDSKMVITQMNALSDSTLKTKNTIQRLSELSQEIGSFATVITEISNQTNILSLNASIEASRAGEGGRGFKVIADEIRKLSMQTKDSSSKISEMISEIQIHTKSAVSSMEINTVQVQKSVQVVQDVGQSLGQIESATNLVDGNLQEVSAVAEEISASVEEVTASIEDIASIANHSESHVQLAVESYKEQLEVIGHISSSAERLSLLAKQLQEELGRFKTNEG